MSMWEIDELLKGSISLVKDSSLAIDEAKKDEAKNIIWSLENLPEKYDMDAGGFAKTQNDDSSQYIEIAPYKLAEKVSIIAIEQNKIDYIYDWSALLLNYSVEYFAENLEEGKLIGIKKLYQKCDFSKYAPKHATLTIYESGHKHFSDEQNKLINWFLS